VRCGGAQTSELPSKLMNYLINNIDADVEGNGGESIRNKVCVGVALLLSGIKCMCCFTAHTLQSVCVALLHTLYKVYVLLYCTHLHVCRCCFTALLHAKVLRYN
jgi:hypothetical protein